MTVVLLKLNEFGQADISIMNSGLKKAAASQSRKGEYCSVSWASSCFCIVAAFDKQTATRHCKSAHIECDKVFVFSIAWLWRFACCI